MRGPGRLRLEDEGLVFLGSVLGRRFGPVRGASWGRLGGIVRGTVEELLEYTLVGREEAQCLAELVTLRR